MRAQADVAWGLYANKPRVSGAWVSGTTGPIAPAGSSVILPVPTTPILCGTGTNPRLLTRLKFRSEARPALHASGWVTRDLVLNSDRSTSVSSAPPGSYCLYNWPPAKDPVPLLVPDDDHDRLLRDLGSPEPGRVFVSVLAITTATVPSTLRRIGLTVKNTLGDLLERVQATIPSVNGAWQGVIVGRDSMKTMVSTYSELFDDDAVHVFDVSKNFAWVCTDWAPPIAVSVDPATVKGKSSKVPECLRDIAYSALAGICDDSTPLPKPEVRFLYVRCVRDVPSFYKRTLSITGGFVWAECERLLLQSARATQIFHLCQLRTRSSILRTPW